MRTEPVTSLFACLLLLAVFYLLYLQCQNLTGRRVTVVINEHVYLKSGAGKPRQASSDEAVTQAPPSWPRGASSEVQKRVHQFPFYEENVKECHLPATGVEGTYDTDIKGLAYGRHWPLMRCNGHSSATEKLCQVLTTQLHECERQQLLQLVDIFQSFARSRQWSYFMGNKMLLGSWRHHGLVPYERELSVFVNISHKSDVLERFSAISILHTAKLHNDSLKITPQSSAIETPFLDILFFEENKTHILHTSSNAAVYVIDKQQIFPLHMRPFGPFDLYAPKSSAPILYSLFGDAAMCGTEKVKVKVPCSDLRDYIGFVYRRVTDYMGPIEERLGWGNLTFQFEFPREDIDSVSVNPFTLKLPIKNHS